MTDNDFQQSLGELLSQIDRMPADQKERLSALAEEARERQEKMKKTVTDLQDSMDYLRLSIKYLLFDLEATRRENAYLRKLLEKQASGNPEGEENESGESSDNE